jgi:CheY-like chemotaxis protein
MRRVAVVDDAADSREILYYLLRDSFDVVGFENAEEALIKFREQPPDLVLMDISLPGLSGIDALHKLRADDQLKHIPVIALTAHAMRGDRERYLEEGFDQYITKPIVQLADLADIIRRFIP